MPAVSMTVNGKAVTGNVEERTLLVQFLREHLRPLERPSHVLRDVGVFDLGRFLGRGRGVGILGELEHRRLGPGRLDDAR